MARRVTPSQLRSMIRQAEQKQKQAIAKYNQSARKYNADLKRAVGNYNREVRAHNSRVRAKRQRLKYEIARLSNRSSSSTKVVQYRSSVRVLHASYERLEERVSTRQLSDYEERVVDLSEREAENSLGVMTALLGDAEDAETGELNSTAISTELSELSPDLNNRWFGAIYALNPRNPDAARHFCTSAREIFTQILELKAPDSKVFEAIPSCDTTPSGKPTRRSKIQFLLARRGVIDDAIEEFVESDMDNIIELFRVFNDGTHGSSGTFSTSQLHSIKLRVEHGIQFLHHIAS